MEASGLWNSVSILRRIFFAIMFSCFIFISCSKNDDEAPVPALETYDLPPAVLNDILLKEVPNPAEVLDKILKNGMIIHQGTTPPELHNLSGTNRVGAKFNIDSNCVFDDRAPANVDSVYGKYEENIRIFKNPQDQFAVEASYSSVADVNHPKYPNGLDRGTGVGFASGTGNNFTIYYKVEDGKFDDVDYQALWIVSGTVSNPPITQEIRNVTKTLIMLGKGSDPLDKVANPGTIRIFQDVTPDWIQSDVVISNFTPTSGPYSTEVTINGSGFSNTKENNIVKINNVIAPVIEASLTNLKVVVPKKAGTGPVTVQVNNKTGTGGVFTYIPVYTVSTLTGSGQAGLINGSGTAARFNTPYGIAVDGQGTIYVSDKENNRLRKITAAGLVTILSVTDPDGGSFEAIFNKPSGVAVGVLNTVYVSDTEENRIMRITSGGIMSPMQDCFSSCFVIHFNRPNGLAIDAKSNLYVADMGNDDGVDPSIRKLTSTGERSRLTTTGSNPGGVAIDDQGNIYFADMSNHRIRKININGVVSTLAGTTQSGFVDGSGSVARFNNPNGVSVDAPGNVYVADTGNQRIRKITPAGVVTTLGGNGQAGFQDGIGSAARFSNPTGVVIDAQGTIYVADSKNNRIRKMVLE